MESITEHIVHIWSYMHGKFIIYIPDEGVSILYCLQPNIELICTMHTCHMQLNYARWPTA